jgi:hypothetical protein
MKLPRHVILRAAYLVQELQGHVRGLRRSCHGRSFHEPSQVLSSKADTCERCSWTMSVSDVPRASVHRTLRVEIWKCLLPAFGPNISDHANIWVTHELSVT